MRRELFYATLAEARDELLKLADDLLQFEDPPEPWVPPKPQRVHQRLTAPRSAVLCPGFFLAATRTSSGDFSA
jgi:hypothetical protein